MKFTLQFLQEKKMGVKIRTKIILLMLYPPCLQITRNAIDLHDFQFNRVLEDVLPDDFNLKICLGISIGLGVKTFHDNLAACRNVFSQ